MIPWATRKRDQWCLEQIRPEKSLEAKMTKPKLSYFRHIMRRPGSLEKITILGKTEHSMTTGKLNRTWIDFIKEATGKNLPSLSRAVDGTS